MGGLAAIQETIGKIELLQIYKQKQEQMGCGSSNQSVQNVILSGKDLYQRKELIGVGHHGRVYRCIYQLDKKQYAIKVISQLSNQANKRVSEQEYASMIECLKELKHPKIANYQYAELSPNQLSLVMQHSKEGSLKKLISKRGKMPEQLTASILYQVLEGLYFLHTFKVIHKDLKPSNVLMWDEDKVKLSDFEVASIYDFRLMDKTKQSKGSKGSEYYRGDSLPYMAPEVILNQGITPKADVWSVGCIAIEMLTGKIPWSDLSNNFEDVFKIIKTSAYPSLPSDLTKECQDFLRCCLSVNVGKRSTLRELLQHPFITSHCKQSQLFFQLPNETKSKLQQNDKVNRVPSRNTRNQSNQKISDLMKTPTVGEKRYADQNNDYIGSGTSIRKISKVSKSQNMQNQAIPSIKINKKVSPFNDYGTISKEDILPQINEDDEQLNVVMLNNKKVKLKSPSRMPQQINMRTQPSHDYNKETRQFRNSSYLRDELEDSFSRDNSGLAKKIGTEPNLLLADQDNKDFFKRPLRLLKKKLNEHKRHRGNVNNSSNLSSSITHNQSSVAELQKLYKEEKIKNNQKIRSNTQSSRDECVINTELARAERDRYINEQLVLKKQRQQQKMKWQEELKKEAEILKKELSHRYAYPYPNIPM